MCRETLAGLPHIYFAWLMRSTHELAEVMPKGACAALSMGSAKGNQPVNGGSQQTAEIMPVMVSI